MSEPKVKREGFSSGLAVFFATLGSAVGLGNIWKFPYLTGANGGGAFLLIYFICILCVGIPVMASEFYIGRRTRKNAVGSFGALTGNPGTPWKGIGLMGVAAAYLDGIFQPVGLPIRAETPEEIGVSVVAELIAVSRRGDLKNLRRALSEDGGFPIYPRFE